MRVRELFKRLAHELVDDDITDVAAMLTYYAVFALFPMLVFVLTVALLVVPPAAIQEVVAMAGRAFPPEIASLLDDQIARMEAAAHAGFALVAAVVALWGASRGAAALGNALNRVYGKKETRPWWKRQLIALGVTVLVAVIVVIALGLLVVGPMIGHAIANRLGLGAAFDLAWAIARWIGAGALVCVVWALAFKLLPDTDAPFRVFTPGAVAGVLLWIACSHAFAVFLDHFGNYEMTYGALAGAIVFLLWLWLSNLALLVGAEVNDVLADLRRHDSPAAAQLAESGDKAAEAAAARRVERATPRPHA